MHPRIVHLHEGDKTKKESNKEGPIMNDTIMCIVEAMQQLPDHVQQVLANHFMWEIREMDWNAIAGQPHSLELAENPSADEMMHNKSLRELVIEEKRTEYAQHIMASIMSKPQKGTKFLQMAGTVEERISPEKK